jgi:hypothetical protein
MLGILLEAPYFLDWAQNENDLVACHFDRSGLMIAGRGLDAAAAAATVHRVGKLLRDLVRYSGCFMLASGMGVLPKLSPEASGARPRTRVRLLNSRG